MCRSCDETPDGAGRRCTRADGFTSAESDQRNRIRNLQAARDALLRGNDPQGAANALANALSAQQSLDGGPNVPTAVPTPTAQPHRDFIVAPSDVGYVQAHLSNLNATRLTKGQPPLGFEVTRQHRPTGTDPLKVWEQVTIRVSGPEADLATLTMGKTRTNAETRISTQAVLAASCAAVRINGGRYTPRNEGGADSTPGRVDAYVADVPGGPWRTALAPTAEDEALARQVRAWVRTQEPTNDYMRAVRHSVAEEYLGNRQVGTAASAVAQYLSQRARTTTAPAAGGAAPRSRSRHFSAVGDKVAVQAQVVAVHRIYHESRAMPHYLHILRTPDGDMVRWMSNDPAGLESGDQVTLRGTVKGHSTFNGEKQTEMTHCSVRRHVPTAQTA